MDIYRDKDQLVSKLYNQIKSKEAEKMFDQTVRSLEQIFGKDHDLTLQTKHWLAYELYNQKKYKEAEKIFDETVRSLEQTLGKDHEDTLRSKHYLGLTIWNQKKYEEAEKTFDQTVHSREQTLGKDHEDTLRSKHWLAWTLWDQKKYEEAEKTFNQVVRGREQTLGKDHENTLRSKHWLAWTLWDQKKYEEAEKMFEQTLQGREKTLGDHPDTLESRRLLQNIREFRSTAGSRTVIHDTIETMADRLDLEKGFEGRHQHFKKGEPLPFESKRELGSGGFGRVDKVLSSISNREYARKRVSRKTALGGRGIEALKGMIVEIEILKKLKHRHIVEFVGSYTDPRYFSVIMSPVVEQDLSAYLKIAGSEQHKEIRTFFGCLATGLQFLHDNQIRHKDIKPSNILVNRGNILFTDFGLALDFTDASGSTTVGTVKYMTNRYCAPEVALQEPRNTSSDIWCLGVVFLEMIVILKGKTVKWIDDFLTTHGSQWLYVRSNFAGLEELLAELEQTENLTDNEVLVWTQQMLQEKHTSRPTAASLVTSTARPYSHGGGDIEMDDVLELEKAS
ncbi:uncharacterized protein BHQ10_009393 [Talaromyces amestolkiae]|uniref:Protein kinase domain-containing protein n=1 Tax=Talaromyces amestolkiae TaxID=1196081 RepID=A0A364LCC9_TALAM|nr:uncharacterized protein BHQ10_009393 [Talaromyces amestolkiae]RAO73381.1 hypothetical protein BHQ10_009393 [Talaromyces amestolkiae]